MLDLDAKLYIKISADLRQRYWFVNSMHYGYSSVTPRVADLES
jgi:hypothetical protein